MEDTRKDTTVISADAVLVGDMRFGGSATILGKVEGSIAGDGDLRIAETAIAQATITASTITVEGEVRGDVAASQKLELNAKASVLGDITARSLVVAEGASFVGHCRVGDAAADARREPRQETELKNGAQEAPERNEPAADLAEERAERLTLRNGHANGQELTPSR